MRSFFLPLLALLLMGAAASPASAQRVITFDDAVRLALDQSILLKRSENSVALQEATVESDRAAFLPNLNASGSVGRNWGLQFDLTTGQLERESSDRFSTGVSSSVNLFNGFSDVASLEQSRKTLAAQRESFTRTRQTVVFNVIQSYLQVILDREQILIREEDVEAQQQQLNRIDEFVRVGQRPISDLYQQQATQANSEALLLNAQRALQLSEVRLIQTLQIDPLGTYVFEAPSTDDIPLMARSYDADALLQNAYGQRSDLRAQEYSIQASEQSIRIARAGKLPRLNLSGGINTSYSSFNSKAFRTQMDENLSQSVSLSLSIPIFDRFQTRTAVERAQIQLENSELDLTNLRQSIALEVRQAFLDYETAVKRLEVTEKQLVAAQQALEVEEERYAVGASTLVELTQARSSYTNAASTRAQAIFQFHFQHRLIEYYQGVLNPSESLF